MRNIRKAAVSGITAVALLAGSTAVATADEAPASDRNLSAKVGSYLGADKQVTGVELFGLDKDWDNIPAWAQIWYVATILGVVGSAVGLITLPVINEAKHLGLIR